MLNALRVEKSNQDCSSLLFMFGFFDWLVNIKNYLNCSKTFQDHIYLIESSYMELLWVFWAATFSPLTYNFWTTEKLLAHSVILGISNHRFSYSRRSYSRPSCHSWAQSILTYQKECNTQCYGSNLLIIPNKIVLLRKYTQLKDKCHFVFGFQRKKCPI